MLFRLKELFKYRELMLTLAWKNIAIRYKQAYLGLAWAALKPFMLMLIFTVVKSFIGIETGKIPYPILTFAALMPWIFFQEATTDGVNSIVANGMLVKKIYFPREIFPLTSVLTKVIDLGINMFILSGMMLFYKITPSIYVCWVPLIILYTVLTSLTISFIGSAINVYYRDIASLMPVALSLLMYISPILYPLALVQKTLLEQQKAGEWSNFLYVLYTANPMVGIIDSFQKIILYSELPDFSNLLPGLVAVSILFPISYFVFKRSEDYFADRI